MKSTKVLGRRSGELENSPEAASQWLATVAALRKGKGICPRGLYRFKSFDEADEWMIEMMARESLGSLQ
ncbi:MAG TPA: hypothetical protein VI895_11955 [Bdellovibrionota bacterium]|nr:hypothetical protein [Bdellovibrionota bacterium]